MVYRALLVVALVTVLTAPAAMAKVRNSRESFDIDFYTSLYHPCTGQYGYLDIDLEGQLRLTEVGNSTYILAADVDGTYYFEPDYGFPTGGKIDIKGGLIYGEPGAAILVDAKLTGYSGLTLKLYLAESGRSNATITHFEFSCNSGAGLPVLLPIT